MKLADIAFFPFFKLPPGEATRLAWLTWQTGVFLRMQGAQETHNMYMYIYAAAKLRPRAIVMTIFIHIYFTQASCVRSTPKSCRHVDDTDPVPTQRRPACINQGEGEDVMNGPTRE